MKDFDTSESAVDNDVYDRRAGEWWDEDGFLYVLNTALNPPRCTYFNEVLDEHFGTDRQGLRALDVGCGGGLMAEEMASRELSILGVDPSLDSLRVAARHREESGRDVEYLGGIGESLPVADETFPVVYCCDVLEHVTDLNHVIRELARVLQDGGMLFFDTINRTMASWIITIKLWQDWPITNFMPTNVHDWQQYIQPDELRGLLLKQDLSPRGFRGITPGVSIASAVWTLFLRKIGRITYGEMGRRLQLERSSDLSVAYMGYAVKEEP